MTTQNTSAKINFNSVTNQRIKEMLVQREVYCNVNGMVSYILTNSCDDRNAPFSWDDVENLTYKPDYIKGE